MAKIMTVKTCLVVSVLINFVSIAFSANDPCAANWPRTFSGNGNTLVMYQPQVDSWQDYSKIDFRAAVAMTNQTTNKTEYGVLAVEANTIVDHNDRMVLITNLQKDIRFPGIEQSRSDVMEKVALSILPNKEYINVSLDQVLAYMANSEIKTKSTDVNYNPPPIFYSKVPAILVIYTGQPQFKPVKNTNLMFAVNTNWLVLMDVNSSQYYLLDEGSWLIAPDPVKGPWTPAVGLPPEFSKLPKTSDWDEVYKNMPGKPFKTVPVVFVSTTPAEMIVTEGEPNYSPIAGTKLMYITNTDMPVFRDNSNNTFYYLVAGRWFKATDLNGPWSSASTSLPGDFAKIPADSPVKSVLSSVPNTEQAQDAVLLASVPHKATVDINQTQLNVTYNGEPKFVPIEGTPMTYATNTEYSVIFAEQKYYCCYQGVWFEAPSATGPWSVATKVPDVIYTIPPSCPLYNVVFVRIYGSTPTTVDVGYTSGYNGEYVSPTGTLMFGMGMQSCTCDYDYNYQCCFPDYYSYGCGAFYNYGYGGYYRDGGAYYGPNGGAGWGAAYNPATGTYGRAGYAYNSNTGNARWGAQAYNPFTNTYAQKRGGTNGYQSWGSSVVSQDGKWAQAGHVSGQNASAGGYRTSGGQSGGYVKGDNGGAVKTGGGNVYAGKDGNVYKKTDNGWQQYNGNGNWENASWNKSAATQYNNSQRTNNNPPPGISNPGINNNVENRTNYQNNNQRWSQQESQERLNQDSYARARGNYNTNASYQARSNFSSGGGYGGDRSFGGGGGGGFRGGGGGGFRGGGRR